MNATSTTTAARPASSTARPRREARRAFGPLAVSLVAHGLVLAAGWWWTPTSAPTGRPLEVVSLAFDLRDEATDSAFEPLDDVRIEDTLAIQEPEPVEQPFPLPDLPPMPRTPPEPEAPHPDVPPPEAPPQAPPPLPPLAPAAAARRPSTPPATTPASPVVEAPPSPAAPAPAPPPAPAVRPPRPPLVEAAAPRPPALPGGTPGATYVVTIEYAIAADGRVTEAVVADSSGWPALDEATRAHLLVAWRYVPPGEPRRASRRFLFRYGSGPGG